MHFYGLRSDSRHVQKRKLDSPHISVIADGAGGFEFALVGVQSLLGSSMQTGGYFKVIENRFLIPFDGLGHVAIDAIELLDSGTFDRVKELLVLRDRKRNAAQFELLRLRAFQEFGTADRGIAPNGFPVRSGGFRTDAIDVHRLLEFASGPIQNR